MSDVSLYNMDCAVHHEICRARLQFPDTKHMLAALVEEVGELAQALIDRERGKAVHEDVWKEAVQVACMAYRIATEGDESFGYDPESGYRGPGWGGYLHDGPELEGGDE